MKPPPVRSYPMPDAAAAYAWRELARRAGLIVGQSPTETVARGAGDAAGLHLVYADPAGDDVVWHLAASREESARPAPRIVVTPCRQDDWPELLLGRRRGPEWVPASDTVPPGTRPPIDGPIPVPFWGDGLGNHPAFAERRPDGSVVFGADILAATLFYLSRWEEMQPAELDEHDRFPAQASMAHRRGYLELPVVDLYALALRSWISELLPDWRPQRQRFGVALSHDIDHIRRFPQSRKAFRALAADVLRSRSAGRARETLSHFAHGLLDPASDAYVAAIRRLADLSREHGLTSEFLFMASEPGPYSSGYDPTSLAEIVSYIDQCGHRVGFHAGYQTLGEPERLIQEKRRLENALGKPVDGGRQHYLRFRVPDTWRHWELAGMTYDSTLGFPEHEGFRCGTCHPYHPYDMSQDRELAILEVPLVAMDTTFRLSRRMTPQQAETRILELAALCRRVEGVFSLLWHNSSFAGDWRPWVPAYERIVERLGSMA